LKRRTLNFYQVIIYLFYHLSTFAKIAEKDKNEPEKMKNEEKDNKDFNEMFFKKQEEILNKSDEIEKSNHEEDQDI